MRNGIGVRIATSLLLVGSSAGVAAAQSPAVVDRDDLRAAFEREVGPLDATRCDGSDLAPESNAAAQFVAAAAMLASASDDDVALMNRLLDGDWAATTWSVVERDLAAALKQRFQAALDGLHSGARIDASSYQQIDGLGKSELRSLIKAARLLAIEHRLMLVQGDASAAHTTRATMARLAASLEREANHLALLVGVAIEKMQLAAIREVVAAGADAATVASLTASLIEVDVVASRNRAIACETAATLASGDASPVMSVDAETHLLALLLEVVRGSGAATEALDGVVGVAGELVPDGVRLRSNLIAVDGRVHAVMSQRLLARAALTVTAERLASGAYPSSIEDQREHGPRIAIVTAADRSVHVELTAAPAYWPRIAHQEPSATLLSWPLR